MGIAPYLAEAIVREHKFRPINGRVLLLGRQTFLLTPEHAIGMMRGCGLTPADVDVTMDTSTKAGAHLGYISDVSFFRLLGVTDIQALDVTDYEGADIIHDLNKPIPDSLANIADFILDGSTLDNIFDPALAIQSIARMLRPGGRFLSINGASAHASPYTMLTPHWFVDFFAVNAFADAKCYLVLHGYRNEQIVLANKATDLFGRAFLPQQNTGIVAFAEKGETSTWDRLPCQRNYASPDLITEYAAAEQRFATSGRPELLRPPKPMPFRFSVFRALVEHYKTVKSALGYDVIGSDGSRTSITPPALMRFAQPLRRMFGV